jgi:hypothetical protein
MGSLQLLKLDDQHHPWEHEIEHFLKYDEELVNDIAKSELFCLYVDINSFISFNLRVKRNEKLNSLKQKIDEVKGNVDYKDITFLFSFLGEGVHHRSLEPLIKLLNGVGITTENIRVLYSTYYDVPTNVKTETFWEFFIKMPVIDFTGENPFIDKAPSKHFLCLIRQFKPARFFFFHELIKTTWWNDKSIIDLSYGVFNDMTNHTKMLENISPEVRELLPIIFDNEYVGNSDQHKTINHEKINQLINIVVETFIGRGNPIEGKGFITEKSMKPFFYFQIPIWVAQTNTVKIIRELGFDVFDDFFENHYYDEIEKTEDRIKEVVKLLDRVLNKNTNLEEFKNLNKDRMMNNWNLLISLDNENKQTLSKKMRKLLF